MTAMSISQDSGAVDSDRAEADEGEEESTSSSTGKRHQKKNNQLVLSRNNPYPLKEHFQSLWQAYDAY